MQARGNKDMAALLERLTDDQPTSEENTFTYCAPTPTAFNQVNGDLMTDDQLDMFLRTHLGLGELYAKGVYQGLTVPTDAKSQQLRFRIEGQSPGVKADGSDSPYSNVVHVDVRCLATCLCLAAATSAS